MSMGVPLVAFAVMILTMCTCHIDCCSGAIPCNVNNMPSVQDFNATRAQGVWYLKSASSVIDRYVNLTGYKATVSSQTDGQGNTVLTITLTRTFTGSDDCTYAAFACTLSGTTCTASGISHVFTIVTIDYDTVFGHWSETTDQGKDYHIFSLYVRDPMAQPDLSEIQSDVQQFCSDGATDPSSSFYQFTLSYDNAPSCMVPT